MLREPFESAVVGRANRTLDCWRGRGLLAAYLYGSIRTGRRRDDSDIDIAVLDSESRLTWPDQAALADELEREIGQPVDLRMLRDCPLSLQAHVLRDGLRFWEEEEPAVFSYAASVAAQYESGREARERRWNDLLSSFAQRSARSHERGLSR